MERSAITERPPRRWREIIYWCPLTDADKARLVMFDHRGSEYFAVIPHQAPGKSYRDRRREALIEIDMAIDAGYPPGEVRIDG